MRVNGDDVRLCQECREPLSFQRVSVGCTWHARAIAHRHASVVRAASLRG